MHALQRVQVHHDQASMKEILVQSTRTSRVLVSLARRRKSSFIGLNFIAETAGVTFSGGHDNRD